MLRDSGVSKINFAGGEPFMHPTLLGKMVKYCKRDLKFPCVQVTTNARLVRSEWMDVFGGPYVDLMTLSIDSFDEKVNRSIGRGRGDHAKHVRRVSNMCREHDVGIKINTVICRENVDEDMRESIRRIDPIRWKVVQMYLVDGMNHQTGDPDRDVPHLTVTDEEFQTFVRRHEADVPYLFAETNERFVGAYLLLNERMCFLSTGEGGVESDSILDVGVHEAMAQCDYSTEQFDRREGSYFFSNAETSAGL